MSDKAKRLEELKLKLGEALVKDAKQGLGVFNVQGIDLDEIVSKNTNFFLNFSYFSELINQSKSIKLGHQRSKKLLQAILTEDQKYYQIYPMNKPGYVTPCTKIKRGSKSAKALEFISLNPYCTMKDIITSPDRVSKDTIQALFYARLIQKYYKFSTGNTVYFKISETGQKFLDFCQHGGAK